MSRELARECRLPEFDHYAQEYTELLKHPVRDGFAGDSTFFHRRKFDLIRKFFAARGGTGELDWIDAGCGRGELLVMGKPHFASVRGCDVSAPMAHSGPGSVEIVIQDHASQLPFADSACDFVSAVCVFHHVEPAERLPLVREMRRVLRPGGFAAIIEHNPINPVTRLIVRQTPIDRSALLMRAGACRRLMRDNGFRDVETRFFLYLPAALYKFAPAFEGWLEKVPLGGQYACFATR